MDVITWNELRDHISEVLDRVDAGESLLVTASGRTVARLSPATGRRWVSGEELAAVWRSPAPRGMGDDLVGFEGGLTDPFDR